MTESRTSAAPGPPGLALLRRRYAALRAELQGLMAQPVRDLHRISEAIDALERVQLQAKAAQGIEGNNPNE